MLGKLFSGTEFLGKLGDLSSGNIRIVWSKVHLVKEKLMLMRVLFYFHHWYDVCCFSSTYEGGV